MQIRNIEESFLGNAAGNNPGYSADFHLLIFSVHMLTKELSKGQRTPPRFIEPWEARSPDDFEKLFAGLSKERLPHDSQTENADHLE